LQFLFERGLDAVHCDQANPVCLTSIQGAKFGVADPDGVLQHGRKHRLKIAGRTADDLEHLRGCRLLLQRFGEFARALLLRLEQPRVLDRDDRLVGKGLDQLDLLLSEWPYGSAMQKEQANGSPLPQKRHAKDRTKIPESCRFTEGIFRISKYVWNLNRFALQQNSAAPPRPGAYIKVFMYSLNSGV